MGQIDDLLRQMIGSSGLARSKEWNSPRHFAQSAIRLGLRDYGFPMEVEAGAFTDGFGDLGLDGVAIALGDIPLLSADEVSSVLAGAEGSNPLRIFFLQSKRKEIVNESDAVLFGAAAQKFLLLNRKEIERLKPNAAAMEQWEIYDAMRRTNERLARAAHVTMIFAYRGTWRDFATVNTARQQAETNIRNALPDMRIEFVVWGEDGLVNAGERVGPAYRKTLKETALVPLPKGAAVGYIGYVSARALVDVVSKKVGGQLQVQDHMFFENVRAFMGTSSERANPGAVGLGRSLQNGSQQQVLLCHNGVVIVAAHGELVDAQGRPTVGPEGALASDTIRLTAPQIVNGCQSCNVLVANASRLREAYVPIKIVITEDEDLKDSIILASNTQAAVDDYDMLARNKGLRALEHTFERGEAPLRERVWLQRRRDEPIDWPGHWERPDWSRVVRPRHLLDAYASAILRIPHTAHEAPGKILHLAREGKIFDLGHEPTLYRALAWLLVAGRRWARRNNGNWQDRFVYSGANAYPARHQFVLALWRITDDAPDETGQADLAKGGKSDQRFQRVINKLVEHQDRLGDAAARAVEEAAKLRGERLNRELVQRKYFTDGLCKMADEIKRTLSL